MPSSLKDNLNSDLMKALTALLPKNAARRVLVYVESDEDIAFWRLALDRFENDRITFDIQLPSKTSLSKGKIAAIETRNRILSLQSGEYLIICVDSDYDYLLQSATPQSKLINESGFIFQTYVYSIENFLCFADSLHGLCVQATKNDTKKIDLSALMRLYSGITYKLFLWSHYFRTIQDYSTFTLTDFCNIVKILDNTDISDNFHKAVSALSIRVKDKISYLEQAFPENIQEIEVLGKTVSPLGLNENNTYLFIQGHTIKNNVVLMFLKPLCLDLKKEKMNEIITKGILRTTEMENQKNQYRKQVIDIVHVLNTNTNYHSCNFYEKIQNDLEKYILGLNLAPGKKTP